VGGWDSGGSKSMGESILGVRSVGCGEGREKDANRKAGERMAF